MYVKGVGCGDDMNGEQVGFVHARCIVEPRNAHLDTPDVFTSRLMTDSEVSKGKSEYARRRKKKRIMELVIKGKGKGHPRTGH